MNGDNLEFEGLKIKAIPTCEDEFGEFNNTSYLFNYKGYNILHTGDIQGMIAEINNDSVACYFKKNYPENIDLLIMPIEGKIKYIPQTAKFIQILNPVNLIPTHYWSHEYLDEFIRFISSEPKLNYKIKKLEKSNINLNPSSTSKNIYILNREPYMDR